MQRVRWLQSAIRESCCCCCHYQNYHYACRRLASIRFTVKTAKMVMLDARETHCALFLPLSRALLHCCLHFGEGNSETLSTTKQQQSQSDQRNQQQQHSKRDADVVLQPRAWRGYSNVHAHMCNVSEEKDQQQSQVTSCHKCEERRN